MAQEFEFTCNNCSFSIREWNDGNPYEIMPDGRRNYIYHPADLSNAVGNASNYICRECGKISKIDVKVDDLKCSKCNSTNIEEVMSLNNKKCIKCNGTLSMEPTGSIS